MEEYQKRVVMEKHNLEEKIERLSFFISGHAFSKLDDIDQALLKQQLDFMTGYLGTLDRRIERF